MCKEHILYYRVKLSSRGEPDRTVRRGNIAESSVNGEIISCRNPTPPKGHRKHWHILNYFLYLYSDFISLSRRRVRDGNGARIVSIINIHYYSIESFFCVCTERSPNEFPVRLRSQALFCVYNEKNTVGRYQRTALMLQARCDDARFL